MKAVGLAVSVFQAIVHLGAFIRATSVACINCVQVDREEACIYIWRNVYSG